QCTVAYANRDNCDGKALSAGNDGWGGMTSPYSCAAGSDSAFQQSTGGSACNAPSAPALVSPQDKTTITVNPPTLNWLAVSGAGSYDSHINNSVFTSTTNSFTPQTLAPRTYTWLVEAIASCGTTKRTTSTPHL